MPLFDYKCPRCGYTEEVLVPRADYLVTCHGACNRIDVKIFDDPPRFVELQLMDRQFPDRGGTPIVNGFNAENGYSTPDDRFKPSAIPGIRTQVRAGRGWRG